MTNTEVTQEEKDTLEQIFDKIKERDEFLSEKRRALAQLRKKMDESIATVWLLSLHEVSREWGEVTDEAWGVYLTEDEALNDLKYYRETECPDEDIIEDGAQYILRYEDYDGKYELKVAPVTVKGDAGEYSNRNIFEVDAAIIATNDGHIHAFTDRLPKGHKLKAGDMVAAIIKKKEARQ